MIYLVLLLAVVHRWVLAPHLRRLRDRETGGAAPAAEPTVTVIVAMRDAAQGIARTIRSVMALDYPMHRLELVVVDDGSSDGGPAVANQAAAPYPNVHVLRHRERLGWRRSFDRAVRRSHAELVLSLEPGDELERLALRQLVRLCGPEIAAVGARVLPARPRASWLGPLEATRCFLEEAFLRSLDGTLGTVACVTGRAILYRRGVLLDLAVPAHRLAAPTVPWGAEAAPIRQLRARGYRAVTALGARCFAPSAPSLRTLLTRPARRLRQGAVALARGLGPAWQRTPAAAAQHLAVAALLAAVPALLLRAAVARSWLDLAAFGAATVPLAAVVLGVWSHRLPREHRVHPLWLLPAVVLMPVTSILLLPLAAFSFAAGEPAPRTSRPPGGPGQPHPAAPALTPA